jgi:hypothetical protein
MPEVRHSLDQCRSPYKWQFIKAQQQGRKRGGWLARHAACYSCGNLQAICKKQGQGQCRFKDVIMPLCWGLLHKPEWREQVLRVTPTGLAASADEGKYMLWLVEAATVCGEQGTNLALIS